MRKVLFLFLFLAVRLFPHASTPSEFASLQGQTSALVYGCVNALTGDLVLRQTDSVVKGAQPLYLPRYYISREPDNPDLRWQLLNHALATYEIDDDVRVFVPEPTGISLVYGTSPGQIIGGVISDPIELHPLPQQFHAGLVHQEGSLYHPRSNRVLFGTKGIKVIHADGSYRVYIYCNNERYLIFDPVKKMDKETALLLLDHEKLSSGHFIHYKWKGKGEIANLQTITASSPKGKLFAKIEMESEKKGKIHLKTSDSARLKYRYDYSKKIPLLVSALTAEYPKEKHTYNKRLRLTEKTFPDGRKLEIKYHKDGKVRSLKGPEGKLCSFEYFDGKTEVTDLHGNKTVYCFDKKQLRLSKITTYQGGDQILKGETFSWDNLGNLLSKNISSDSSLFTSTYTYDHQGKVTSKIEIGAITGEGTKECYCTSYTYNRQNLLVEETEDNGLSTSYTYLEGTSLPTSKIVKKHDRILRRTFYEYDEDHLLTCEIIDDGPNPTERHTKKLALRKNTSFYGMPESIEEYVNDIFLKKTVFTYDIYGNVSSKTTYDSENTPRYKEEIHYNDKGQIEKEIDAKGHVTTYAYDANGNKIEEISPLGLKTIYTYDTLNRCTSKSQENYLTTFSSFTLSGKPEVITDPLQGITRNRYDALGNLIAKTDSLGFATTYAYNALGQQTSITDPLGHTTNTTYNMYGSPLGITHPDGTEERYTYRLDGKKQSYTDQNGNITYYTYDDFGNISCEETYHNGECIYRIERTYNAFHLLEEIDSEGVKTTYTYGPSGKLEQKATGTLTTTYSYDTLGRCTEETSLDYTQEKTYDELNRVIGTKEYSDFILLTQTETTYDAASHILTQTTYPNNQKATTEYKYDHFGREIEKKDPLGQKTTTAHTLGKGFLEKKTLEPGDIALIETYNTLHQKIKEEKKHLSQTIAQTTSSYDSVGNLLTHTTTIYREGSPHNTHTVAYTYDTMGRKRTETESALKTTTYAYTSKGQLATLTKPNHTVLTYTYDPLGNLQSLHSSDQTIHYTYAYNTKGQLLSSEDHIHHLNTHRILDPYGNLLEESLANGHTLKSTYDPLNRRTSLKLPNGKTIYYTYEGLRLKTVQVDDRLHTYTYDQADNILFEQTLSQTEVKKTYDLLHRIHELTSPTFQETCTYNPRGNLIQRSLKEYAYDPYDHLIEEPNHHYTYDSLHNRTSKDDTAYTINSLNQVEEAEETYHYDQNGNLIRSQDTIFTYDALDRLIQVTTPQKTYTYTYDSEHRRIRRADNAYLWRTDDSYLWDGQHELGTLSCYRILGPTKQAEIGSAIALILQDTPHIPVHDCQGNLIQILNLQTTPTETRTFTSFGECSPLKTPWGFCSKRHDEETEFVYFGRRYYDPHLGRFITADPEGYTDSYNLYAYCSNNPLTHFDPYGLAVMLPGGRYWDPKWEDFRQTAIGVAHGVGQWTVDTSLGLAKYGGGICGYSLPTQTYQNWKQSSQSWIQNTLGADTNSAFYNFGYQGSYIASDLASTAFLPFGPVKGAKTVFTAAKTFANTRTAYKVADFGKQFFQSKRAGSAIKSVFPSVNRPATSSVSAHLLKNKLIAEEISRGHAFEKHVIKQGEFPGLSQYQFQRHLQNILNNPTEMKLLTRGRTAYWDQKTGTVIIRNPVQGDGGTAFRPTAGYDYFLKELK